MNILNWIRKSGIRGKAQRADAHAPGYFSALGNAIEPEWGSGWSPDDSGRYETRRHVGQSAEGFHAGVEISYRVRGRIVWSEAYSTPERAREAAAEMECTPPARPESETRREPNGCNPKLMPGRGRSVER